MPIVIRAVLAFVGVGVAAACTRPSPEQTATPPPRYLEDGVLVSTCRPVLRLRAVADSLTARSLRAFSILPQGGTPSCAP